MGIFSRLSERLLGQVKTEKKEVVEKPRQMKSLGLANKREPAPKFQGNSKQRRKQRRAWERQQVKAKGIQDDPEC